MTDSEKIERLQAISAIQTADLCALSFVVYKLSEIVRRDHPDTPDTSELYKNMSKAFLGAHLRNIENTDPGLAARLQELIDNPLEKQNPQTDES